MRLLRVHWATPARPAGPITADLCPDHMRSLTGTLRKLGLSFSARRIAEDAAPRHCVQCRGRDRTARR